MKKILLSFLTCMFAGVIHAQEADATLREVVQQIDVVYPKPQEKADTTYWKTKGLAGLNFSQVSLSNWAAGGDGSVAFDVLFNYSADYKKGKNLWNNRLELAYGLNNTSSDGARKTNDKIYLSSTYGYEIAKNLYWSTMLTYNTQFANGYDYENMDQGYISRFMAPGYLLVGTGITWTPKKWFTATFSPASWRGTFVCSSKLSEEGAFGVTPGERLLSEIGGNLKLEFNLEVMKNMHLHSRVDFFSDYTRKPQNIDVRWDTQLNMKINKWFSANFTLSMIYDDDVKIKQPDGTSGPRLQVKETLGVGVQAVF